MGDMINFETIKLNYYSNFNLYSKRILKKYEIFVFIFGLFSL